MNSKIIKYLALILICLDLTIYFINPDYNLARFLTVIALILLFKDDFKKNN
ncbi:hypothetical protein EV145_11269 [Flavobacterium sp. 245]|nr:hypothetical protein EV145_11269 [Flavobacterium sp. 245]